MVVNGGHHRGMEVLRTICGLRKGTVGAMLVKALEEPWEDWVVIVREGADEVIFAEAQVVLLGADLGPTEAEAVAHASSHLDLGHHELTEDDGLTSDMERWVLELAAIKQLV